MKLIFVYNANSGTINALLDSVHKVLQPATYDCNLCAVTFGNFTEKKDWKAFRETSKIPMIFLHKDEFLKQYKSKWLPKFEFPVILSEENNQLNLFMDVSALSEINTSNELIEKTRKQLLAFGYQA